MRVEAPGSLANVRAIDLSTNSTAYAGRLLADLGADVIRLEPETGSPVRRLSPIQKLPNGDVFSFAHAFFDSNKRSAILNIEKNRPAFEQLVRISDVLILSPNSGSIPESINLTSLLEQSPKLIVATLSPHGIGGPYTDRCATDLTLLASGGLLSFGGYTDSEPYAVGGDQAFIAAAIFGAVGIIAALVERQKSGKGKWIDVSAQECVSFALEDAIPEWYINGKIRRRYGDKAREAGTGVYPCKNGYISMVAGRLGTAKAFVALTQWVAAEGDQRAQILLEERWKDFKFRQSAEGIELFADIFRTFCSTRTKQELYEQGQARQIAIAPVNLVSDLTSNIQLGASEFFHPVFEDALARELIFPGPPYRLSATPARAPSSATRLGEHTSEVMDLASIPHRLPPRPE